ncbi:MAG: hypothetical protein LBQ80_02070 [Clostridium sp.]|jgi:uncharacterized protein involved in exopolysaccharide biosynthesis|nr:hypothetical protein [Clostridium sp.]
MCGQLSLRTELIRQWPELRDIAEYLRGMKFKRSLFGCDKENVLENILELTQRYEAIIEMLFRELKRQSASCEISAAEQVLANRSGGQGTAELEALRQQLLQAQRAADNYNSLYRAALELTKNLKEELAGLRRGEEQPAVEEKSDGPNENIGKGERMDESLWRLALNQNLEELFSHTPNSGC